jgi:hypothetical protein
MTSPPHLFKHSLTTTRTTYFLGLAGFTPATQGLRGFAATNETPGCTLQGESGIFPRERGGGRHAVVAGGGRLAAGAGELGAENRNRKGSGSVTDRGVDGARDWMGSWISLQNREMGASFFRKI